MTLWTVLGLIAVILLLATLIGMRLPKTHAAASRIRLPFPPEEVFALITDFPRYAEWRPGLSRVETGPLRDGLPTWYEYCGSKLRVQFRVCEWQPPHRLVTCLEGENLPLKGTWRYELEARDGGSVLTIIEQDKIHHPLLRFFSRYLLFHHGAIDVFLIALARRLGVSVTPEHLSVRCEGGLSS